MTSLYLSGKAHRLTAAQLLGSGGEADVFDLGDGTALKQWKAPEHPDLVGDVQAQAQARARLDEQARKLPAFPAGLPSQVVIPREPAYADRAGKRLAGYRMAKVEGVPLHHLGEPRWRREHGVGACDVVAPLRALAAAIDGLHRRDVVIGDFNDLNVLVSGPEVHLIDADSFQYGPFLCSMFSERFLDPRLCAGGVLLPSRPHDRASDWFAFAVMLTRTLLLVSPWGGVYQPADPARRCTAAQRVLRRISIFEPEVTLPRAAAPLAVLPEEVRGYLREVFAGAHQGPPPLWLWDRLRLTRCSSCGLEHAQRRCPACAVVRPPLAHHGRLRVEALTKDAVRPASHQVARGAASGAVWLESEALWRRGALGRERIGGVLGGQTWAFTGESFGAGCYRAGGYCVGFVFDPRRGVLDDRLRLPPLPGEVVLVHGAAAADRVWLFFLLAHRGKLELRALVLGAGGILLAHQQLGPDDPATPWHAGLGGACAIGPYLFVPTDAGVVRLELDAGGLALTRTFPETAPWVCAGDRLAPGPGALDVLRADSAHRLHLS